MAIVFDYESFWAVRIQPGFAANNFHEACRRWYKALNRAGVAVDVVPPGADLRGYKAVFAPDLYILPDTLARQLSEYVAKGGVLVTDCRTGVKNETNLCGVVL